jgi:predicted metal-dependent peptidase
LFLPSLHSIACGKIVVAIDTSGSIDDVMLAQFGAEIQTIASELQPSSVAVIYCDSSVNKVETFERGELVTLKACGGGGTAFAPVFEAVEASGDVPAVLVYLTDLDGSFPDAAPEYPVVWCAVRSYHRKVPFGDLVVCE